MKFPNFRLFRPFSGASAEKYLGVDLVNNFKLLTLGLTKLSFEDNFAGFIVSDLQIASGQEVSITNQLGEPVSQRVILRGGDGAQNIVDGNAEWTREKVSLQNVGGVDATVTVAFLK